MKNNPFILTLVGASVLFVLLAGSCKMTEDDKEYTEITARSTVIKSTESIIVRFRDESPLQVSDSDLGEYIKISPATEYIATSTNAHTLRITPVKPLSAGNSYRIELKLCKLISNCISESATFKVMVPKPSVKFKSSLTPDYEGNTYTITGSIEASDIISMKEIAAGFKAEGCAVKPEWKMESPCTYNYTISNIKPADKSYTLKLKADYDKIACDGVWEKSFEIPAKNYFGLVSYNVESEPQRVELLFSMLVNRKIDIAEYIVIDGRNGYKYNVTGNKVTLYPDETLQGRHTVGISKELSSAGHIAMGTDTERIIDFGSPEPVIEFISKGTILPSANNNTLLFRAANYRNARIRVKRIYENNILQFLQDNDLDGYYIYNVARVVADTTIVLGGSDETKVGQCLNYSINMEDLIKAERGAIYRVEIRGVNPTIPVEDKYESDYYFGNWETYKERSRNVFATDLAVMVKGEENNRYHIFTLDIISGKMEPNVAVKLYNSVNQEIAKGKSDKKGECILSAPEPAVTLVAEKNGQKCYIKVDENRALQISNFQLSWDNGRSDSKAFIFGERDVWRPGDTLHISVIPTFAAHQIEKGHPVVAELYNPKGQMVASRVQNNKAGILVFDLPTGKDYITGRYEIKVKIGNNTFSKAVRVETIKPNNLKLDLDFGSSVSDLSSFAWPLSVNWLYGAPGSNLKYNVKAKFSKDKISFQDFPGYSFNDMGGSISSELHLFCDGITDAAGKAILNNTDAELGGIDFRSTNSIVKANFTIEVYEPSGEYSTFHAATSLSPFSSYTGVSVDEETNEWDEKFVNKTKPSKISVVTVNPEGKLVRSNGKAVVAIYRVDYSWWWNSYREGQASYTQDSRSALVEKFNIGIRNGCGEISYDWSPLGSGIYIIQVTNSSSGHSCAKVVNVSDYYNPAASAENGSVSLPISLAKESFQIGEDATLRIPSGKASRALVSIEKGNSIIESFWVNCEEGETTVIFPVTEKMFPNSYIFVSLIQPHKSSANDAPIRLYGVTGFKVEDGGATKLNPVISMPESIRPQSNLNIEIREQNGKAMNYVLMVVDEGFLNMTGYKTPDPWSHIYSSQSLGVRTWDVYDKIIGAYGGKIEQLFAIGGDNELVSENIKESGIQRFKAIARVLGPFELKEKKTGTHNIYIPQYAGSLRVMAVAAADEKFGSSSNSVTVKSPLMVYATLPRRVATGEEIIIPVTVISTESKIRDAAVTLKGNEFFDIEEKSLKVRFDGAGEQIAYFRVKVGETPGNGKFTATVSSGNEKNVQESDIEIIEPNPSFTLSKLISVDAGKTISESCKLAGGVTGSTLGVEVSAVPSINIEKRVKYLVSYPYGCVEQIVSSAFAQVALHSLLSAHDAFKDGIDRNVKSAINNLSRYALGNGELAYWPGTNQPSEWGTVYAAHFLVSAEQAGYYVPAALKRNLLEKLEEYVSAREAKAAIVPYSLYVLALDGKSNRSGMNYMRENLSRLGLEDKWFIAASYALDGKVSVAGEIINNIGSGLKDITDIGSDYNPFSPYLGSYERTLAVALTTHNIMKKAAVFEYDGQNRTYENNAFLLACKISEMLSDGARYMSTQSIAWCMIAMGGYIAGMKSGDIDINVKTPYEETVIKSNGRNITKTLKRGTKDIIPLEFKNNGNATLFCNIYSEGVPEKGSETEYQKGMEMDVKYYLLDGKEIHPEEIVQGTDFYSVVTVRNTSYSTYYSNLALNQRFASGWEIINQRLGNQDGSNETPNSFINYQDIRDDRIYTFFSLPPLSEIKIKNYLKAAYKGKFYLPAVTCEAMYSNDISAARKGMWVVVK